MIRHFSRHKDIDFVVGDRHGGPTLRHSFRRRCRLGEACCIGDENTVLLQHSICGS